MIKNLLDDNDGPSQPAESEPERKTRTEPAVIGLFDPVDDAEPRPGEPFSLSSGATESTAETVRRSGLAWSMGVVFVVSVVFMLILGWGADLLFGSSPWGVVVGIVIGAIIGFYQLYRLSSQMFRN